MGRIKEVTMQLSLDVIDIFQKVSHTIASSISEIPFSTNIFGVANILLNQPYELHEDELVFTYPGGSQPAIIAFSEITPINIRSIEIDEPIKLREDIKSVALDTWNNAGSTPLTEIEKWTQETTTTEENNISSALEAGMSAKLGAEYAGFKAEVEAHLTAKLGLDHKTGIQNKVTYEHEQDIEIPPYKRVSLVQKHSISDFKQTIRTHCEVSGKVRINSGWEKSFDSLKELQLYMLGGGGGSGNVPGLDNFVIQRKFQQFLSLSSIEFTVEKDRLYNDVQTGEVDRTEVDAKTG